METAFGQYNLLERIAAGGMGEVYLARITRGDAFQKIVAVKKILPELTENREFLRQFENEARFAARLNHANIVSVYDFGTIGSETFLAMEYVDGVDLATLIDSLAMEQRRIGLPEVLGITAGLARGLDYLHRLRDPRGNELGLIHQDISPQNVLISSEGEIKITDFGLVRAVQKSGQPLEGRLLGKLAYMAPEQFRRRQPDRRCDIFSVGCVMYEMLAGRLLLGNDAQSTDPVTRTVAIEHSLNSLGNTVSPEVMRILRRCVAQDADARYPDARSLRADIQSLLAELGSQGLHPELGQLVRQCPKRRHEANMYLEADRTLVADKPIYQNDPETPAADSRPGSGAAASRRTLWVALGGLLLIALAVAGGYFWWRTTPAGHLLLQDVPQGATVIVDDSPVKVTGAATEVPVYGRGLRHHLVVQQRFFAPFRREFDFSRGDAVAYRPHLERLTGSVDMQSEPPGAVITFDDQPLENVTPLQLEDVPLGKPFKIRLELPGQVPFTGVYTLTDTQPLKVHHNFESITISATVTTRPADSMLWVDGKRIAGMSPFELEGLSTGTTYSVEAHRRGYRSRTIGLAPRRGQDNRVDLVLAPIDPRLKLENNDGFTATLAGEPVNGAVALKPGASHMLLLSNGKGQTLGLRLKLMERVAARGVDQYLSININARPWATIALDRKPLGETPLSDIRVSAGTHVLSFTSSTNIPHQVRLVLSL